MKRMSCIMQLTLSLAIVGSSECKGTAESAILCLAQLSGFKLKLQSSVKILHIFKNLQTQQNGLCTVQCSVLFRVLFRVFNYTIPAWLNP